MKDKNFIEFLNNFFENFDINNLNHCQNLIYLIFNNICILKNENEDINKTFNDNLQKIGSELDIDLLKNLNKKEKKKKISNYERYGNLLNSAFKTKMGD